MLALPLWVRAQEKPLNVLGTFYTGYYNSYAHGDTDQSLNFVPVGAKFDIDGYYMMPDFLSFSLQPEFGLGPQASDAGFLGGNGIRLHFSFLRKRIPLTFRYSNVQVEDVYFGSLTQLSSYTAKNRNKELGVTWEFHPHGAPKTTVDFATQSLDSVAGIAGIPDYLSHGNHLNADTRWDKGQWALDGFVHHQYQASNLLDSVTVNSVGTLDQTVKQYQATARRSLFKDSEFFVEGGSQSTSNLLFAMPLNLSTKYVSANLRLRQKSRWKTSLRAAYYSNLASQLLATAATSLTTPGAVVIGNNILAPFSHGAATFEFDGLTSAELAHGFGVYGNVERNEVLSASLDGPLNTNYFTVGAGVTYAHHFSWASLTGQYGRDFGVGSITGQSGTIQGQTYNLTAQRGTPDRLEYDAVVHGADQTVHNAAPVSNHSISLEAGVGRRVYGSVSAHVAGGWQHSSFGNSGNDFRSNGYLARASIEHPRFQFSVSLNDTLSNALPLYSQLLTGVGIGSVFVPALQIIPSDFHALSFTLHTNPTRKIELSAFWTKSQQHLDGILNNDFQLLNVYLTYHFRRLQLESGIIHSSQLFLSYPTAVRERFYLRLSRTARIL
jgi:hypothetical protein